jgi:hypothetical protein
MTEPPKTAKCMCPYQKEKDACHPDCLMFKALNAPKGAPTYKETKHGMD